MATSRNIKSEENETADFLTKSKILFQKELEDRIKEGEDLTNLDIKSHDDLDSLNDKFSFWHSYNIELLSRSFSKINNKYHEEYIWSPSLGMIFSDALYGTPKEPSLNEKAVSQKQDIRKFITHLKKIKERLPLIEEIPGLEKKPIEPKNNQDYGLKQLQLLFNKFHKVSQSLRIRHANRETIIIKDEYDVQDLLHALLRIYFNDIRQEDYSPSYAGGNSRIDFVLKDEKIVVEIKMTNDHLSDKEVGSQLLIDFGRYKSHADCKLLVVFVYDKGDYIRNKAGLINDLEKMSTSELKVKIFIEP